MFIEDQDANITQETSPEVDETSESSTEETQVVEATTEQATEEKPFHEHPRFQEVVEEKNEYKREIKKLQDQLFELTKPRSEQKEEVLGQTPEEREFWKLVGEQSAKVAKEMIAKEKKLMTSEIGALRKEYGRIMAGQFLKDNPDIKKGSPELKDILTIAQQKGLDLDEAKKIVMFDKIQERTVSRKQQVDKKKIEDKINANSETSDVSPTSPIQPGKKETVGEFITRQLKGAAQ